MTPAPVRRSIRVAADPDAAFRLFTDGIDRWWPLREGFAYGGERAASIHLEPWVGGRFFERLVDGDEIEVGRVRLCDRPELVEFSWRGPLWGAQTWVRVVFRPDGPGTRVELTHDGFGALSDGAGVRGGFAGGWVAVLESYGRAGGQPRGVHLPLPDPRPDDLPWPPMVWPVPADLELTGRHVSVRTLDPARDAEALFTALDDDEVWAHLPERPPTVGALRDDLAVRSSDPLWHVWLVTTGERVVGMSSFLEVSPHDARLEIGWTAYSRHVWGTVVNPETKLLLLGLAFDRLQVGRVQLKTDIRNVRSQLAIDRLGARHEGVLRRYQRRRDGSIRDTVLFSVTAEDWPAVRAGLEARLVA